MVLLSSALAIRSDSRFSSAAAASLSFPFRKPSSSFPTDLTDRVFLPVDLEESSGQASEVGTVHEEKALG